MLNEQSNPTLMGGRKRIGGCGPTVWFTGLWDMSDSRNWEGERSSWA